MAYSVKKVGSQFYVTVDTGSDLTGKAANFSIIIRNNANGDTVTGITTGAFSELAQSAGTYQVPVTITVVGDYTAIIENATDSLGSITAPLVVTAASMDDIFAAVDTVEGTLTTIAADVANVTTNVNAHTDSLIGTSTDTIAGTLFGNLYLAKQVIDSNASLLNDGTNGLANLKTLIDGVSTKLGTSSDIAGGTSIYSKIADANTLLTDGTNGLAAIKSLMVTMDGKLDTINTNVSALVSGSSGARIFV